ncbi:MAG: methyl-accepting chemotaxis protein [Bdellovibrio sp.]
MNVSVWLKGIRAKLLMSAILPILAVGFMTYISFSISHNLGDRLDFAYQTTIPNLDAFGGKMESRMTMGYRIWAVLGSREDQEYRVATLKGLDNAFEEFQKEMVKYEATPSLPEETEFYKPFKEVSRDYIALNAKIIEELKKNTPEADARVVLWTRGGIWQQQGSIARTAFGKITDFYAERSIQLNAEQKAQRAQAELWSGVIGGGACVLLMVVLLSIAHRLAKSVGNISEKINEAGSQVTAAIEQLSAAGQSLSHSSTQAAASLEETVASLEEMTSMVSLNSDNAKQASSLSVASRESAERGQNEIQSLVSSMNDISQSSRKIEEIINVIDDIAFQTNLLALNAAVEAARAGEQGKGFAVVADAVRALAQRSAEAAKDITQLIKDSVDKIDRGTHIADKSGTVMSEIVNSVKKVSDLAEEIATSSNEQKTGIQQISKAMNDLDASSQSNAASSEEIASTAEEISSQSMQMQKMMEDLTIVVNGANNAPPALKPEKKKAPPTALKAAAPATKERRPAAATEAKVKSADLLPLDDIEESGRGTIGKISGF